MVNDITPVTDNSIIPGEYVEFTAVTDNHNIVLSYLDRDVANKDYAWLTQAKESFKFYPIKEVKVKTIKAHYSNIDIANVSYIEPVEQTHLTSEFDYSFRVGLKHTDSILTYAIINNVSEHNVQIAHDALVMALKKFYGL